MASVTHATKTMTRMVLRTLMTIASWWLTRIKLMETVTGSAIRATLAGLKTATATALWITLTIVH